MRFSPPPAATTADAFVACGGNSDCTGNIEREALIKIVKEDFGLTIDIQSLIEKFENDAGQLSYEECVDF
jgi:calmodulin